MCQQSVSVMNHTLIFVDESHHFSLTTAYCSRSHGQLNRSYCMQALSGVGWDHKDLVRFILHIYKKPCTIWLVKLLSFNKLSPYNLLSTVNNDLCSCFLLSHILFFMLPILYQNRQHMEAKLNHQTELILCAVTISNFLYCKPLVITNSH